MNMMESVAPSPRVSSAKSEVELLEEQLESMQIHDSQVDQHDYSEELEQI